MTDPADRLAAAELRQRRRRAACLASHGARSTPTAPTPTHDAHNAATTPGAAAMSTPNAESGVELIAAERRRQVEQEGWTSEHDDEHDDQELVRAAIAYAAVTDYYHCGRASDFWPWGKSWWNPSDEPVRNLVKAGALIAAEIDRLRRTQIDGSGASR